MWQLEPFIGAADEYQAKVSVSDGSDRELRLLEGLAENVTTVVRAVGGYISVSAVGHFNSYEGGTADNLNIQLSSVLRPSDPTPDAGLEAALGSARNFPPEASTAAPATEDNSPPATQEPIPLPADAILAEAAGDSDPTVLSSELQSTEPSTAEGVTETTPPAVAESAQESATVTEPASDPVLSTTVQAEPSQASASAETNVGGEIDAPTSEQSPAQEPVNGQPEPVQEVTVATEAAADPTPPAESDGPTEATLPLAVVNVEEPAPEDPATPPQAA